MGVGWQESGPVRQTQRCCPCRIRGNGEVIKREEFEQRKSAAEAARQARLDRQPRKLASDGKDLGGCPLLEVGAMLGRCACEQHTTPKQRP
jgi:hypothetical protein